MSTPDKNTPGALRTSLAGLVSILLVSCSSPSSDGSRGAKKQDDSAEVRELTGLGLDDLDFGQDWDDSESAEGQNSAIPARSSANRAITGYWTVVLGTYASKDHRKSAHTMVSELPKIDPRLGRAHVHTNRDGSMVVYGIYENVEDKDAQEGLKWIQGVEFRGRKVFTRAMLTRIDPEEGRRTYRSYELMSIRTKYPNIDPLYTLQVAVWGQFAGSGLTMQEVREKAEAYTKQLRAANEMAFVHHDDTKRLSMVTVGIFDQTAIDAQSGLIDPRVEALKRKYPAHLVNGEPLDEPISPRQPSLGTRVQGPRLVKVPKKR